jgi:hypothetical protein
VIFFEDFATQVNKIYACSKLDSIIYCSKYCLDLPKRLFIQQDYVFQQAKELKLVQLLFVCSNFMVYNGFEKDCSVNDLIIGKCFQ